MDVWSRENVVSSLRHHIIVKGNSCPSVTSFRYCVQRVETPIINIRGKKKAFPFFRHWEGSAYREGEGRTAGVPLLFLALWDFGGRFSAVSSCSPQNVSDGKRIMISFSVHLSCAINYCFGLW